MKKRGKALRSNTITRADFVTSEFLQHHRVEDAEIVHFGDGKQIKPHRAVTLRVRNQRLIDKYFVERILSLDQHAAADRLFEDHDMSMRPARVTANLMGVGGGGGGMPDPTARQIAARQRFDAALKAIRWRDRKLVCAVVLQGAPAGRRRRGVVTPLDRLIAALERLIKHYGIG